MAGGSLVFRQAEVLKSSWERKWSSGNQVIKKLALDLNLQHKHSRFIEQLGAEIP